MVLLLCRVCSPTTLLVPIVSQGINCHAQCIFQHGRHGIKPHLLQHLWTCSIQCSSTAFMHFLKINYKWCWSRGGFIIRYMYVTQKIVSKANLLGLGEGMCCLLAHACLVDIVLSGCSIQYMDHSTGEVSAA